MKVLMYDKFYILVKTISHIFSNGYFKNVNTTYIAYYAVV